MFKDMLVAVDIFPTARAGVELAAELAEKCGAHLIGLHTTLSAEWLLRRAYVQPGAGDADWNPQKRAEMARQLFEQVVGRRGLSWEWRVTSGDPSETAALHGRYVDLIVLGQLDPDDTHAPLFRPVPEEVALGVGRPLLLVPYAGKFGDVGRRVLIGWDASREATRAVNDALPILRAAQSVTILVIDPRPGAAGHGELPGADIGLHLARHGVKAKVESTTSGGIGVGNVLLSRASDVEADLLVMGAYGHSRVRELLLGGATRTILESMTIPVLIAH